MTAQRPPHTSATPLRAIAHQTGGGGAEVVDRLTLDYAARLLRRKRLRADGGLDIVVDLPRVTSLSDGDRLLLEDGRAVAIHAAAESLLEIRGDLPRLAWHVGNRHTPCQIGPDWLRIPADSVMADMLRGLGAEIASVEAPFMPEGGAYGHGRTLPHAHGPAHDGIG